jgi:hypothetical protein
MIEQYLPNKNESATKSETKIFWELNKASNFGTDPSELDENEANTQDATDSCTVYSFFTCQLFSLASMLHMFG